MQIVTSTVENYLVPSSNLINEYPINSSPVYTSNENIYTGSTINSIIFTEALS